MLILTRPSAISFLTALTVAPITTTIRGIPTEVVLTSDDGVRTTCAVNLDNIQTVPKENLKGFITHLSLERMLEVRVAIAVALGFEAIAPDSEISG